LGPKDVVKESERERINVVALLTELYYCMEAKFIHEVKHLSIRVGDVFKTKDLDVQFRPCD
jgi:hypothetical protein